MTMGLFDKDIWAIFKRYSRGRASDLEKALVEDYYDLHDKLPISNRLSAEEKENLRVELFGKINRRINRMGNRRIARLAPGRIWLRYAVAACVAAGLLFAFFQYRKAASNGSGQIAKKTHPIAPARPRAVLVRSDGNRVDVTDAPIGSVGGDESLMKVQDGLLKYDPGTAGNPSAGINTLETPRGGYYQLILADGSHIWLDVASSLRYDAHLTSRRDRTVELSGRAYFEIAPDDNRPFIVHYRGQVLRVLGTRFDIDAYGGQDIRTTVLGGKVKVGSVVLAPGQQGTLTHGRLVVSNIDTGTAAAWRENVFIFQNTEIHDVLMEASRWYDFDVSYDTDVPETRFAGRPSRHLPLADFLRIIGFSGLHFSLHGDTLHVSK
jgi:transmembrane sensor